LENYSSSSSASSASSASSSSAAAVVFAAAGAVVFDDLPALPALVALGFFPLWDTALVEAVAFVALALATEGVAVAFAVPVAIEEDFAVLAAEGFTVPATVEAFVELLAVAAELALTVVLARGRISRAPMIGSAKSSGSLTSTTYLDTALVS
jgi:hypothetical protein